MSEELLIKAKELFGGIYASSTKIEGIVGLDLCAYAEGLEREVFTLKQRLKACRKVNRRYMEAQMANVQAEKISFIAVQCDIYHCFYNDDCYCTADLLVMNDSGCEDGGAPLLNCEVPEKEHDDEVCDEVGE